MVHGSSAAAEAADHSASRARAEIDPVAKPYLVGPLDLQCAGVGMMDSFVGRSAASGL